MSHSPSVYQFSGLKPCYYCGATSHITKEHAPVNMLFRGISCGRFTVPSCDMHNAHKNGADKAVMALLLRRAAGDLKNVQSSNVVQLLKRYYPHWPRQTRATLVEQAHEVMERIFVDDDLGLLSTHAPYVEHQTLVLAWMRQLTAALVWTATGTHHTGASWDNAVVWSPSFWPEPDTGTMSPEQAAVTVLRGIKIQSEIENHAVYWWHGWSPRNGEFPPDVYRFEVSLLPMLHSYDTESGQEILFRHFFFGNMVFYVWLTASLDTKSKITALLDSVGR